ncbi:tRNA-5-carboxymethylaminomethyl-2-thiouridine(34)synthesis protein MnmE [hydrothermal vent metagenome]|uniref:tRNA-5-carboxymethylaminomethyl-2-thiouridine(34) synthesis protein MnmE n=1 Tax=hydrothermal vent metagenome TaxID=652676 RepID=A0A3B1A6X2_9ZZZZ
MPTDIQTETIAAVATPTGRGGVGIVRVSGPLASQIAKDVLGHSPKPRQAEYLAFKNTRQQTIDQGIALYFPAPNSFTGEDVLELQGHGGPVVMDMLLNTVIEAGARLARSGEFSERAFLNDKLDLAQAEAIADLIDAGSEQAARSAMRSLQGEFSAAVHDLVEQVTRLRIFVEASIDFPEEEIDFISEGKVSSQIEAQLATLATITSEAQQGSLIREGIHLVLVGQPNAGKSSLLNTLAQRDAAIVTEVPGTTRDIVKEAIMLDGLPIHILDTAGLRPSEDQVEKEGMRRTWEAVNQADVMLLLVDNNRGFSEPEHDIIKQCPDQVALIVVFNKCDLSEEKNTAPIESTQGQQCRISAKTGQGIDKLISQIKTLAGMQTSGEGAFMARRRHLVALDQALSHLQFALQQANQQQGELIAEELKLVQQHLGEITGELSSDDLLGKIFSEFCIGK